MVGGNGTAEKLEGMLSGQQYDGAAGVNRLPEDYKIETPADVAAKKKQQQTNVDGSKLIASTEDACKDLSTEITGGIAEKKDQSILELVADQENEIYTSQKAEVDLEYNRQKAVWDAEKEARQYRGVVKAYHVVLQWLGFEKIPTEQEFTADKKQIARDILNAKIKYLEQQKQELTEQAGEVTKEKRSLHDQVRKVDRRARVLYNNLPLLESKIKECDNNLANYDDKIANLGTSEEITDSIDDARKTLEDQADNVLNEKHAYEDARMNAKDKLKSARVKIEYKMGCIAEVEAFEQIVYEEKDSFERELDKMYILANEGGASSIGKTLRVLAKAEEMKSKVGTLVNTTRQKWADFVQHRKRNDPDEQIKEIRKDAKPFRDYTEKNKDSDANTLEFFGQRYASATKA